MTPSTTARVISVGAGLTLLVLAGMLGLAQIEVGDSGLGQKRSCGSALDTAVDESGWEQWWALDMDEPDAGDRDALIRSQECPSAVNRRIMFVAAVGFVGAAALLIGRSGSRSKPARTDSEVVERVRRLGLVTSVVGWGLLAGGAVALFVLVSDAESTLFLYVDRIVVGVIGLVVLVPPAALILIGRVLSVASTLLHPTTASADDATPDDPPDTRAVITGSDER